jgi:hypothetical protein
MNVPVSGDIFHKMPKEQSNELLNKGLTCTLADCNRNATYGLKYMTPIYCRHHGLKNGSRHYLKVCICGLAQSTYGNKGDHRPSCCKTCKTPTMIDLRDNKCKGKDGDEDCTIRSSYGNPGEKPTYCAKHREPDMIDLVNDLCEGKDGEKACTKLPCFGTEKKTPRFCFDHKLEGMENVIDKKCEFENCKKKPSQGLVWGEPTHCAKHAEKNTMKNVVSRRCEGKDEEQNCEKLPTFGLIKGNATHCFEHKTSEMFDVKHMRCSGKESDGKDCQIRPSYGNEKSKPIYCVNHKEKDMWDVVSYLCDKENCFIQAGFGFVGKTPTRCFKDKEPDMIDLTHNGLRCHGPPGLKGSDGKCPYEQRGTKKYDGFCTTCFPVAFPRDSRTFTIKKNSDELIVRDYLAANFPELNFIHDKPLWTHNCDCSHRRRIDLRTQIEGTILAVEVDEHQHKYKDVKDEELRYDDVFMIHSGKWCFIRYNPHTFLDSEGKRKNPAKSERLTKLKEMILTQIGRIRNELNTDLVEIHKMYYSEAKV